jgi:RNA polymerase sigma factor (sigma-70 family)
MTPTTLNPVVRHLYRITGADLTDAELLQRFVTLRDEAAFAALLRRHGRLVLAVCRRVLAHEQDAEDAFQATFLTLVRRAGSIRRTEAIGSWLYRVAYRIAQRARTVTARRSAVEQHIGPAPRPAPAPACDVSLRELQQVLDDELHRLPEKLRAPFVLCCLDGKSRSEAARELGWKAGTVAGRLAQAREKLQRRLTRRGIALSAVLCAAALAPEAVAAELLRATRTAALQAVSGAMVSGVSAAVAALVEVSAPLLTRGKLLAALAVFVVGVTAGAAAWTRPGLAPVQAMKSPPTAQPQAAVADNKDALSYGGRVLGPDDKPVAGAKVYLAATWSHPLDQFTSPVSATTGPDGRFAFTVPKDKYKYYGENVVATSPNLGVGWASIHDGARRDDLTLKLAADDVPITGQVVDLEGQPIRGATLRLLDIKASPQEDLGPWLEAARDKTAPAWNRYFDLEHKYLPRSTTVPSPTVTTDAAGRFRLTGIGRDRIAVVRLDGPGIVSECLHIRTRPGETIKVPTSDADPEYGTPRIEVSFYGADFRYVAGPTKPIVGVIRDKDTKQPLAGFTVRSYKLAHNPLHYMDGQETVRTTTDAQGRYRLVGMPKGVGNKIMVKPPSDQPYVAPGLEVPDSPGLDPVTVDVELKRAIWIEGRLTDKATGKPLRGYVTYAVRSGNPNLRDYLDFWGDSYGFKPTNEDGTYRVIGLPGPGRIMVRWLDGYLLAAERDDEGGMVEDEGNPLSNYGAIVPIDPPKGVESFRRDIAMVQGWTFTGTVLGPDGKPMSGTVMARHGEAMTTADFTVRQFNPRRPRPTFFRLPEKGLVGVPPLPKQDGDTVTVRMEPGASVTGRLVDVAGAPRVGVELRLTFRPKAEPHWNEESLHETVTTGRDGRFRIDALLPDFVYYLNADHSDLRFGDGLRLGETKDLGDVRIR